MSIATITFGIIDGPSRDAIFDSMKYCYETRLPLDFKIIRGDSTPEGKMPILVTRDIEIHAIQHEDGTGFKFNLDGFLDIKVENKGYVPRRFKAFYNAKTRKGSITFKKF